MDTKQENNDSPIDRKRHWRGYGSLYGGVYVLFVGLLFLLNNFGYFQGDAWGKLWPIFIIIPGLFMIVRSGWLRRD
jgi:hypothetical protein